MVTVNVHEAKTQLSRLLARVARLAACTPRGKREFGSMKGLIKFDDRFFDPLPEEELRMWEGG